MPADKLPISAPRNQHRGTPLPGGTPSTKGHHRGHASQAFVWLFFIYFFFLQLLTVLLGQEAASKLGPSLKRDRQRLLCGFVLCKAAVHSRGCSCDIEHRYLTLINHSRGEGEAFPALYASWHSQQDPPDAFGHLLPLQNTHGPSAPGSLLPYNLTKQQGGGTARF